MLVVGKPHWVSGSNCPIFDFRQCCTYRYSLYHSCIQTHIGTGWFKSHLAPEAKYVYYTPSVKRTKRGVLASDYSVHANTHLQGGESHLTLDAIFYTPKIKKL